jgi:flagellin
MKSMRINHNISALNAWRALSQTDNAMTKSLEKLSSGLRINRAADDAAGLAISEKMRGQIRGLNQAIRNAQDAISLIQTAEGAMNETHAILQRMRELAVQAASDTNTDADRAEIQKEIDQLAQELTRIGNTTEFNTKTLLDGSFTGTFHIGANEGQNITVSVGDIRAEALGVGFEETAESAQLGTSNNVPNTGAVAEGVTYTVAQIDAVDVGYDSDSPVVEGAQYALLDSQGNAVAVSADGKQYYILSDATAIGELSSGTAIAKDGQKGTSADSLTISFNNAVMSGAVYFEVFNDGKVNKLRATTANYGIGVLNQEQANNAIATIQDALNTVSTERSKLGAVQNRLEHTIANLGVAAENLTAAESRIRDVDMAQEMMEFTKNQILIQAGTAMLANANVRPQSVLQLLG